MLTDARLRLFAAALLALVACLPATAHHASAHTLAAAATTADTADFAAGRSQYVYQVHDDAGTITTLSVGSLPTVVRGGMRVAVSGQHGADASSLRPQRITILAAPADGSEPKADMIAKAATSNSV